MCCVVKFVFFLLLLSQLFMCEIEMLPEMKWEIDLLKSSNKKIVPIMKERNTSQKYVSYFVSSLVERNVTFKAVQLEKEESSEIEILDNPIHSERTPENSQQEEEEHVLDNPGPDQSNNFDSVEVVEQEEANEVTDLSSLGTTVESIFSNSSLPSSTTDQTTDSTTRLSTEFEEIDSAVSIDSPVTTTDSSLQDDDLTATSMVTTSKSVFTLECNSTDQQPMMSLDRKQAQLQLQQFFQQLWNDSKVRCARHGRCKVIGMINKAGQCVSELFNDNLKTLLNLDPGIVKNPPREEDEGPVQAYLDFNLKNIDSINTVQMV